ncbi:hypothetical protein DENSPDRAFT_79687 [Dentipellis sp. KUC8613]|nr:hypothetical protein DENSPDRAFT_79687 [Dentipellis sp. KUC8613]
MQPPSLRGGRCCCSMYVSFVRGISRFTIRKSSFTVRLISGFLICGMHVVVHVGLVPRLKIVCYQQGMYVPIDARQWTLSSYFTQTYTFFEGSEYMPASAFTMPPNAQLQLKT